MAVRILAVIQEGFQGDNKVLLLSFSHFKTTNSYFKNSSILCLSDLLFVGVYVLIYYILIILFCMYVYFVFMYVSSSCMFPVHAEARRECQNTGTGATNAFEPSVGDGNCTLVLCNSIQCFQLLNHSFSLNIIHFYLDTHTQKLVSCRR